MAMSRARYEELIAELDSIEHEARMALLGRVINGFQFNNIARAADRKRKSLKWSLTSTALWLQEKDKAARDKRNKLIAEMEHDTSKEAPSSDETEDENKSPRDNSGSGNGTMLTAEHLDASA